MIRFLAPLALLSLLALLLPVAIHLLSRQAGKIVKVGSIQFLLASTSARFKSLKLSELPLLCLRLVLLVLLALLLAQPLWSKKITGLSSAQEWIVVAPELLTSGPRDRVWPLLDSLAAHGHELRLFSTGFPALKFGDPIPAFLDEPNNWSLLRELDQTLPVSTPLRVFATARLLAYRGERPNLQREITWKTFSTALPYRWLHNAHHFSKDSLRAVIGSSTGHQTRFSSHAFQIPMQRSILGAEGMPPLEYIPKAYRERAALRLVQQEAQNKENDFSLPLETDSMRIAIIHTAQRSEEARYLQTALQAVRETVGQSLRIMTARPRAENLGLENFDFAFWLAEDSLPAVLWQRVEHGLALFTVANSPEYETCASWMVMPRAVANSFPRLWRRGPAGNIGAPVWTDGFGVPLLQAERRSAGWHYHFASRFDPAWNELVLHAAFPEWLLSVLLREDIFLPRDPAQHDQRRISFAQSVPQKDAAENFIAPYSTAHALHFPLWLLAVLIFGMERWMSDRKKN